MPWGKYKGCDLYDVPEEYLVWVLDHCDRLEPTMRWAIGERLGLYKVGASPNVWARTLSEWYWRLIQKHNPHNGGSPEAMKAVVDAYESLRELLGIKPDDLGSW